MEIKEQVLKLLKEDLANFQNIQDRNFNVIQIARTGAPIGYVVGLIERIRGMQ